MKKLLIILAFCPLFLWGQNTYYVAHIDSTYAGMNQSSDSNNGSFLNPWATWKKGFESISEGDTLYIRGGVYFIPNTTSGTYINILEHEATKTNRTCIFNYPGETPILDGMIKDADLSDGWNTAIQFSYSYNVHFRGLTVRNLFQGPQGRVAQGYMMYGVINMRFENCTAHDIAGRGWYHLGGFPGAPYPDSTYYINCDAYNAIDSLSIRGDGTPNAANAADGFFIQVLPTDGGYVLMDGCRAWRCSDDGINLDAGAHMYLNNVWAFDNAHWRDLGWELSEGNGAKLDGPNTPEINRTLTNCIFAGNNFGFTHNNRQNGQWGKFEIYNTFIYDNVAGTVLQNIAELDVPNPADHIYRNNLIYKWTEYMKLIVPWLQDRFEYDFTESNNSWRAVRPGPWKDVENVYTITDDDFVSLDMEQLKRPRKADHSLPDITFGRLEDDSPMKGQGYNVGMSTTPDIGIDWAWLDAGSPIDSTATDITAFSLLLQTGPATINTTNHTVNIQVYYGADITELAPTLSVSSGANASPPSGTTLDFTLPVPFMVTALDGETEQSWLVTVTVASAPPTSGPGLRQGRQLSVGRAIKYGTKWLIIDL